MAFGLCSPLRAQTAAVPEAIGSIVGDDVTVKGAITFDVTSGRSSAVLASGSEITVRSGKARIDLSEDDSIAICGPAHLTLIKSGGALTIALDYGEVHPQLSSALAVTIYMPLIVATPVAIGPGPRDLTIGLNQNGELCAMTARGALRIEEQLGGQGLLVPQGGEVGFNGGQLNAVRNSSGVCSCELLVVANTQKKQFAFSLAVQPPVQPAGSQPPPPAPLPPLTTGDVPVYRISVPLVFDARAPRAPAVDPPTILFEQEALLRPETFFWNNVEPAAPPASRPAAVPPPPVPAKDISPAKGSPAKKTSVFAKLFGAFHKHRSAPHCVGVGCDSNS
jgi:hypothetical protein